MTGGWRAHLIEAGVEFLRGDVRLILVQDLGDRVAVNLADHTMKTVGPGEAEPRDAGWVLPHGAWNAIVDMVQTTSRGEVARLEEALTVERDRVDRLLDRIGRE